jgi:hypothetical protein
MLSYQITIGQEYELSLPDDYCDELGIDIGDILRFSTNENGSFSIEKHDVQSMTDEEIDASGNLARVIEANGSSQITTLSDSC